MFRLGGLPRRGANAAKRLERELRDPARHTDRRRAWLRGARRREPPAVATKGSFWASEGRVRGRRRSAMPWASSRAISRVPGRGSACRARADAEPARARRCRLGAGGEAWDAVARGAPPGKGSPGEAARLSAFLDTNVLVRYLTGDPPGQARRAARVPADGPTSCSCRIWSSPRSCYVLESFYEVERAGSPSSFGR